MLQNSWPGHCVDEVFGCYPGKELESHSFNDCRLFFNSVIICCACSSHSFTLNNLVYAVIGIVFYLFFFTLVYININYFERCLSSTGFVRIRLNLFFLFKNLRFLIFLSLKAWKFIIKKYKHFLKIKSRCKFIYKFKLSY